jgi:hypothetical protein
MTNTPRPALGFDSAHIANQYSLEHITERPDDKTDSTPEGRISVLIYDPRDPDEFDAQIKTLQEATDTVGIPYFR